mmetsp:Transcript_46883/g.108900  ORF Transcript_46883/g.108900 Transcript_46883/m.108900 type:complete len:232 (+) Transcript_46883:340-1035(+)
MVVHVEERLGEASPLLAVVLSEQANVRVEMNAAPVRRPDFDDDAGQADELQRGGSGGEVEQQDAERLGSPRKDDHLGRDWPPAHAQRGGALLLPIASGGALLAATALLAAAACSIGPSLRLARRLRICAELVGHDLLPQRDQSTPKRHHRATDSRRADPRAVEVEPVVGLAVLGYPQVVMCRHPEAHQRLLRVVRPLRALQVELVDGKVERDGAEANVQRAVTEHVAAGAK